MGWDGMGVRAVSSRGGIKSRSVSTYDMVERSVLLTVSCESYPYRHLEATTRSSKRCDVLCIGNPL